MKYFIIFVSTIYFCGSIRVTSTNIADNDQELLAIKQAEKEAFVLIILKQLSEGLISADAGWEVYSNLMNGELRGSMLIYINMLSEFQKINPKNVGYKTSASGVFIRDCSTVLSIEREVLLKNFCSQSKDNKNKEEVVIDARRLFLGLHNGEIERLKDSR